MLNMLQQFYKAFVFTVASCRQKAILLDDESLQLSKELEQVTLDRDRLVAEQEEAVELIEAMMEELARQ